MDQAVRIVATLTLYLALALACCVPPPHLEMGYRLWALSWCAVWLFFMLLLVVADRSLYHHTFKMIGFAIVARIGASILLVRYIGKVWHKLPYAHSLVRGVARHDLDLELLAPIGLAMLLFGVYGFLLLRRDEEYYIARR